MMKGLMIIKAGKFCKVLRWRLIFYKRKEGFVMKIKDVRNVLSLSDHRVGEIEVDIERIVENHFFDHGRDYKKESVDFMIKKRVNFSSTVNTDFHVMSSYIKVKCPVCRSIMKSNGGGGSTGTITVGYVCSKCNTVVSVTIPCDGIRFNFDNTKKK